MFDEFKWSPMVTMWLVVLLIACVAVSYNMPEHPAPNRTVLLPGHQFILWAIRIISIASVISVIRKRTLLLDFKLNQLEGVLALSGAMLFVSPFIALLVKFLAQVVVNAYI
ncbi:MAG TPA: hypothetical protein GX719_09000 [Gammaproteobacteria bacterium]|nr:hypothetical protein [Gammaproteobacteria bacterium]